MLVFTTVEAPKTNMANWLQQAQHYTGITNVTITQENEAYNDHQRINSGEKSTVHYSSHPSHCGVKCMVENSHCTPSAFSFQSSTANVKTVCRGLLYFTFLKLTSTLVGQHSTARLSMILASSGSSNSTAAFHKRTEFGTCSRAREDKQLCQSQQSSLPKTIVFLKTTY